MDADNFQRMISIDFFFNLADSCHRLFQNGYSGTSFERMLAAFDLDSNTEYLKGCFSQIHSVDMTIKFISWLYEKLKVYLDETQVALKHPKMRRLHFLHYNEKEAAWHNLRVEEARLNLLSELEGSLKKSFPHWDANDIKRRLWTIPPLVLLGDEFTSIHKSMISRLDLDFLISFLRSSYIVHLGEDPLPDFFSKESDSLKNSSQGDTLKRIIQLLRDNRPRYCNKSHVELFQNIRLQQPFSEEFNKLYSIESNEKVLEDILLAITFKLSIPYAHGVVNNDGYIESMIQGESPFGSFHHVKHLGWIVKFVDYLKLFKNANNWNLLDISFCVPLNAELASISLEGTYAEELYTTLDELESSPDEEFDDQP